MLVLFNAFDSLIPKPPVSLDEQTLFQANQAIFFHSELPPQRKCLWIAFNLLITAEGAL